MCEFNFTRSFGFYLYQVYVPAFLIVVISWVPFWLDREDNHARVGLGVTTVLTMTTLTTNTNASLPKISYIKAIDIYLFMSFLMVFLSLIEYATVGFFESSRSHDKHESSPCYKMTERHDDQQPSQTNVKDANNNKENKTIERRHYYQEDTRSGLFRTGSMNFRDSSCIDKFSRVIFPIVFFVFNIIYAYFFLFLIH